MVHPPGPLGRGPDPPTVLPRTPPRSQPDVLPSLSVGSPTSSRPVTPLRNSLPRRRRRSGRLRTSDSRGPCRHYGSVSLLFPSLSREDESRRLYPTVDGNPEQREVFLPVPRGPSPSPVGSLRVRLDVPVGTGPRPPTSRGPTHSHQWSDTSDKSLGRKGPTQSPAYQSHAPPLPTVSVPTFDRGVATRGQDTGVGSEDHLHGSQRLAAPTTIRDTEVSVEVVDRTNKEMVEGKKVLEHGASL